MITNLALLAAEALFLGGLALGLHAASRRYGLAPLLIFLSGLVAVLHAVGSVPVSVQVGGLSLTVANSTIVPVILMTFLVMYDVDGTAVARVTILGLVCLSVLALGIQLSRQMHVSLPGGFVATSPSDPIFTGSWHTTVASMVAFIASLVTVAVVHQTLRSRVGRLPGWVSPGVALGVALVIDDVIVRSVAFGPDAFLASFPGGLPGKGLGWLVLWPLTAAYLSRYAPELSGYVGSSDRGSLDLVFGTYRQREVDLRVTEARLRSVVAHAPIILFGINRDGTFTLSEGAGLAGMGLAPGEVVGQSAFDLFPEVEEQIRAALDGRAFRTITELAGRFYDVSYSPRYRDRTVIGLTGVATDITARRQAELALHESEIRFRSTFEQAAVGLIHASPDGRILRTNRFLNELLGFRESELVGRPMEEILHPDHRAVDRDAIEGLLSGERSLYIADTRFVGRGEEEVWTQVTCSAVRDASEGPKYLIAVVEDLTERLTTEGQLRQAQKMEAVGQLTGGVAHDFNNLLTVVISGIELAIAEPDDEELRSSVLSDALRAAERGASLTQRLLAFSRRQALMPVALHPADLLNGMYDLLARTLEEAVTIVLEIAEDVGTLEVDRTLMEGAVLNLAVNARDAMPAGGTLRLVADGMEVGETEAETHGVPAGPFVRITVEDDGTGIAAEHLDHVFEPFFTTKATGKGSGLGLSMVYGFVQQSGGFVTLDSTEGEGTRVALHLPAAEPSAPSLGPDGAAAEPEGDGEVVLLVEDDPGVRALAAQTVRGLGYEVLQAERGAEAIELLRTHPGIAVLLTDVVLPDGMSGVDVAREALVVRPDLPVLYASGYSGSELAGAPASVNGMRLLHKPLRRADLARSLREALVAGDAPSSDAGSGPDDRART